MSAYVSHGASAGHEKDLGFGRVFWILPLSVVLLLAYVAICWFGAKSSLKNEMSRKEIQTVDGNNGTSP